MTIVRDGFQKYGKKTPCSRYPPPGQDICEIHFRNVDTEVFECKKHGAQHMTAQTNTQQV